MSKTLEITTGSLEKFEAETLEELEKIKSQEEGKSTIIFQDPEMFREVLTEKRQELIQTVMEDEPGSIRSLAGILDRGVREVHEDVHLLEKYGIIELLEEGNRKKPTILYDRISIEIDLPVKGQESES